LTRNERFDDKDFLMEISSKKLARLLNGQVTVKVSDVLSYQGILKSYDEYLNIVLHEATRHAITLNGEDVRDAGLLVIRGSNVISVEAKSLPELPIQSLKTGRLQVGVGSVKAFGRGYINA
jgi:small nuclear ribonucleoprotein (snRNP)-like protein